MTLIFPRSIFPFLRSNIPISPTYDVFVSQLARYVRIGYWNFHIRGYIICLPRNSGICQTQILGFPEEVIWASLRSWLFSVYFASHSWNAPDMLDSFPLHDYCVSPIHLIWLEELTLPANPILPALYELGILPLVCLLSCFCPWTSRFVILVFKTVCI